MVSQNYLTDLVNYTKTEDFDTAYACLLIGKESARLGFTQDFQIDDKLNEINRIVDKLKIKIKDEQKPEFILKKLTQYLMDRFDYRASFKPYLLNEALNKLKTNCASMPSIQIGVCERLGLPFKIILDFPQDHIMNHTRVAYLDDSELIHLPQSKYDIIESIEHSLETKFSERFISKILRSVEINKRQFCAHILNYLAMDAHYLGKDYNKSIDIYDAVIEMDPKNAMAYDKRGVAKSISNRHEEALEDFDKSIIADRFYAEAWNSKGRTYLELGNYQDAIESYKKAIEIDPYEAEFHLNLSRAYEIQKTSSNTK